MNKYNDSYKYILKKYGPLRDKNIDELLTETNIENNYLSNNIDSIRNDYFEFDVYTIDPEGCLDADDGFSIEMINNKMFLIIHIADPTHYIDLESELWRDIQNRVLTHYPSNNKPIHMMPEKILNKASLNEGVKNAISVFFEIDQDNLLPINKRIEFTRLLLRKENNFTYKQAANSDNHVIKLGVKISKKLKNERSKKTIGTKLSDVNLLIPKFKDNKIYFEEYDKKIKEMKEMISEFAILTNSYIGEFIKNNLDSNGIFRTCQSTISNDENLDGKELLNKIINEGVKAEYNSIDKKHDLVGSNIYCHFTSPIRRLADCICHYLIKFYFTNTEIIWNKTQLNKYAKLCYFNTKNEKKIQYLDHKFRIIQLIDKLLPENKIEIEFIVNNYTGMFINIIINKLFINDKEYLVNLSYTLRAFSERYFSMINKIDKIKITQVNPLNKYDQGSIVDLDNYFLN